MKQHLIITGFEKPLEPDAFRLFEEGLKIGGLHFSPCEIPHNGYKDILKEVGPAVVVVIGKQIGLGGGEEDEGKLHWFERNNGGSWSRHIEGKNRTMEFGRADRACTIKSWPPFEKATAYLVWKS